MPRHHTVSAGESIASIAAEYGFVAETLWSCAENASLRQARGVLAPLAAGDVVFIPDRREHTATGDTGRRHRFRRRASGPAGLDVTAMVRVLRSAARHGVPFCEECARARAAAARAAEGVAT